MSEIGNIHSWDFEACCSKFAFVKCLGVVILRKNTYRLKLGV